MDIGADHQDPELLSLFSHGLTAVSRTRIEEPQDLTSRGHLARVMMLRPAQQQQLVRSSPIDSIAGLHDGRLSFSHGRYLVAIQAENGVLAHDQNRDGFLRHITDGQSNTEWMNHRKHRSKNRPRMSELKQGEDSGTAPEDPLS